MTDLKKENFKLTKEERERIRYALKFYIYEVTHDPESQNGCAGLPEGEEKKILERVLWRLEND